jgi:exodeoxyribonuclease III
MAFRRKARYILDYGPDILVVPECEHPDKLLFPEDIPKPTDILWFGQNRNKGLAVFSYGRFHLKVLGVHNEQLQMIVPIVVADGRKKFTLFAVWANNPTDRDGQYIEQVWKALHCYEPLLTGKKVILVGDFNSNSIWDRPRREGNHSNVVKFLERKRIFSAYHSHFNQLQGKEKHPTLYLYRHIDKPYHIDYCFVSAFFAKRLISVEVGKHNIWAKHSDHIPVVVTFNDI